MAGPVPPDSIGPGAGFKVYTLGASDIDLLGDGGGPARAVYADTPCTLRLYKATDASSYEDVPFQAGVRHDLQTDKIGGTGNGSTPAGTKIVAYW